MIVTFKRIVELYFEMKLVMLIVNKYNGRKQICSTKHLYKVAKIQADGFDQFTGNFFDYITTKSLYQRQRQSFK